MSYVMWDVQSIDLSNAKKKNCRSFDQIFSKSQKRQKNDKKVKKITKNAKK